MQLRAVPGRNRLLSRLTALVAASMLMTLSACSGGGGSGGSKELVTISLVSNAGDANVKATKAVIALFEKSHPNIKVKFEPDTGAARQGSVLRIGQGDPTLDIGSAEVGYQYQWLANGWISPLTKYFTKAELDTVVPHLVDEWTSSEGEFLGVPTDNSGMWLAVNQDLLKKAGVTPPPTLKRGSVQEATDGVWTWEQVLTAAKQVKEKTGKTGLIFPGDQAWATLPLAEQLGALPTSPDGRTVKGYLDQPPWVEAMTRWKRFFDTGGAAQVANPEWTNDQFLAGNAAFQLTHLAVSDECLQAKFDCDAAAQPHYEGGQKMVQSVNSGWVLNSKSQHPDEAAAFMKFVLLDPAASKALVDGPFFAGISMLKDPVEAMPTEPEYQKFPRSIKVLGSWQSENWPQIPIKSPVGATIFTSLSDAYKDTRTGAATPQAAVDKMVNETDRQLQRYN